MSKEYRRKLANQIRAMATDIIENADDLVGNADGICDFYIEMSFPQERVPTYNVNIEYISKSAVTCMSEEE